MKKYRIVPMSGLFNNDYKIQAWRKWFPFWIRVGFTMSFGDKESAIQWLTEKHNPEYYSVTKVEEKV